jgi:peptide/nickel transport system permease protein
MTEPAAATGREEPGYDEIIPGGRFRPVTWFLNNAKWYGAEWWITLSGGVLLVAIILMTIFADRLAPYDPIKFVGAPFTRPGARQSVIVLQDNDSILGLESLQDRSASLAPERVGVVTNSQAARELDARGIAYQQYSSIRLAVQALQNGELDALVTDAKDPKYKKQIREQGVQVKTVGAPFGTSFVLGTDNYGRDVLSRVIYGARTVIGIAILAAAMSAALGIPFGLLSAFVGGAFDRVLSLVMDSLYSFPGLILAIVMAALLGPGVLNVAIAIAVIYVPVYFRLVRGKVLSVKQELYVEAAQSLGASVATILGLYVFPNVIPSIVVIFSVNVADSILTEAGLSFLGLGLPPPTPDWGFDLSAGKRFVPSGSWWIITFPGMMIALLTLGFSLLGEGLNEILNPRLTES